MAFTSVRKPCYRCYKGIGILTCDGCQHSFCTQHIVEHRRELADSMERIIQDADMLQRDLISEQNESNFIMNRISVWEKESINTIQQIAEQVRNDVQRYINQEKKTIKLNFDTLANELKGSRDSGDFTENDFKLWIEKITNLRDLLVQTQTVDLLEENDQVVVPIRMIKIKSKFVGSILPDGFSRKSCEFPLEYQHLYMTKHTNFILCDTNAELSENDSVVRHSGNLKRAALAYVSQLFSDVYRIRFQIDHITKNQMLFGVVSSTQKMDQTAFKSISLNGWISLDKRIVQNTKIPLASFNGTFNENDQITLTLKTDTREIVFEHSRTKTRDQIGINVNVCPLPWYVVVGLFNANDTVRIIP